MVLNGWKKELLGHLLEFKNGLNTEKDQFGSGYKFVNVMDIFKNKILTESTIIGRVQVTEKQLADYQIEYGDILFNRTSETFEEIAMAAVYLDTAAATFGGFVIRGRPTGKEIAPSYSSFLFQSSFFRNQVIKLGQGAVRANIGQKDLSKVTVLIPPLPEQQKIAQILSTWDKAITTTEKLLANAQLQKKALMQQLLTGKKRLKDENGERFSGEWAFNKLENLCHINPGKKANNESTVVSFIPMDAVSEDAKILYLLEKTYLEVEKGFVSFTDNDVLIAKITPCFENGKGCLAKNLKNSIGFGSTEFHVLRAKKTISPEYLYYLTNTREFRSKGEANMQGSAGQKRVPTNYLKNLTIYFPKDIAEQNKISATLSTLDNIINQNKTKILFLKNEKKSLMQQLLTGKRRVKI